MTYQERVRESEAYYPAIRRVLDGHYKAKGMAWAWSPASNRADVREATDVWLKEGDQRYRCQIRMRTPDEYRYYHDDFTISGPYEGMDVETCEWFKMQAYGVGRYIYGVQGWNYDVQALKLLDMALFFSSGVYRRYTVSQKRGRDQQFFVYKWDDMPDGFVLYAYPEPKPQQVVGLDGVGDFRDATHTILF